MNPVAPNAGTVQPSGIVVPRPTQYQYWDGEEGPWAMIPYAVLYPPPPPKMITRVPQPIYRTPQGYVQANMPVQMLYENEDGVAWLPPPIVHTEMMSAAQIYPL